MYAKFVEDSEIADLEAVEAKKKEKAYTGPTVKLFVRGIKPLPNEAYIRAVFAP